MSDTGITFPRTTVAGISMPRILIGSNWIAGYSHTSPAADAQIKARYADRHRVAELYKAYLEYDINATMAIFEPGPILDGIHEAEDETGKKVILIDTPILDVDDNAEARARAEARIAKSAEMGCTFCFPHHASAEQLVNKNIHAMPRLPDYLDMIRQHGLIPGLSAHMPELILYSDLNEYDVESYIQIYNCMGFLMQVEIEYINMVIWEAKKPVMTIKSMAAGRCSPFVGISFSFATIRPCDMVTIGAYAPSEVHEDVEIALAAIERRRANIGGRATPAKTPALGGEMKRG